MMRQGWAFLLVARDSEMKPSARSGNMKIHTALARSGSDESSSVGPDLPSGFRSSMGMVK